MEDSTKLHRKAVGIRSQGERFRHRMTVLSARPQRWVKELANGIGLLWRMLGAWMTGRFRLSRRAVILILGALAYFLNPIDLIPDFIPVIGLLDDFLLYLLLTKLLSRELQRFAEWEEKTGFSDD